MAKANKQKTIKAADLFCGAGGTSTGLVMAANAINAELELIAINHWQVAIDTHSANHEYAQHYCTGIDSVDPRKLVPGGYLDILCASPECTHHSNARGGKPMSDQSRSSGWHILRFAEALYIDSIVLENVPEWLNWGPLGKNGRPLKSKRGELFQQFIASLKALGYRVEHRILNCADYGDPTSRKRLFVIARRGNKQITWPEPTHAPKSVLAEPSLFADDRKPWRTAREIIDWHIPSQSIFERKKSLAPNTVKRIQAGIKKYWGVDVDVAKCLSEGLKPFIVVMRNHGDARSIDEPLPTLTAGGTHVGIVEPFMVTAGGTEGQGRVPASLEQPLGTVLTNDRRALIEPFVLQTDHTGGGGNKVRDIDNPVPTLVTKANTCVVEPFLTSYHGDRDGREDGAARNASLDNPLPTQDTSNRFGMVEPFLIGQQSCAAPRGVDDVVPTVATAGAISLTEPFLVPQFGERDGQAPRTHSVDEPAPAVTSHGAGALVQPFILPHPREHDQPHSVDRPMRTITATSSDLGLLEPFLAYTNHSDGNAGRVRSLEEPMPTVTCNYGEGIVEGKAFLVEYYGTQNMSDVENPVPTVTANDRFALVEGNVEKYLLDIRFRMLQPKELARAQGFPDSYKFKAKRKKDVVKMIGNAVPPNTAKALILEALGVSQEARQAA